ncbi:hypothetical protein [Salininema proteolyticum]|uniref:Uncharacterized protein n=1 Tax=Salininema proteolyticum TaxID=1607685 RepID=A0ABV8U3C3_9ACTN
MLSRPRTIQDKAHKVLDVVGDLADGTLPDLRKNRRSKSKTWTDFVVRHGGAPPAKVKLKSTEGDPPIGSVLTMFRDWGVRTKKGTGWPQFTYKGTTIQRVNVQTGDDSVFLRFSRVPQGLPGAFRHFLLDDRDITSRHVNPWNQEWRRYHAVPGRFDENAEEGPDQSVLKAAARMILGEAPKILRGPSVYSEDETYARELAESARRSGDHRLFETDWFHANGLFFTVRMRNHIAERYSVDTYAEAEVSEHLSLTRLFLEPSSKAPES